MPDTKSMNTNKEIKKRLFKLSKIFIQQNLKNITLFGMFWSPESETVINTQQCSVQYIFGIKIQSKYATMIYDLIDEKIREKFFFKFAKSMASGQFQLAEKRRSYNIMHNSGSEQALAFILYTHKEQYLRNQDQLCRTDKTSWTYDIRGTLIISVD